MVPEGSLPCSQEPATGTYSEPDESSPHIPTLFPCDPFKCYPTIYTLVFQVVSSVQVYQTNIFMVFSSLPMYATCAAHLILTGVIIIIIFDETYKLWRSSLCNDLKTAVSINVIYVDFNFSRFSTDLAWSWLVTHSSVAVTRQSWWIFFTIRGRLYLVYTTFRQLALPLYEKDYI
jgi:hypothetical protein